jgi:hypothetical protein
MADDKALKRITSIYNSFFSKSSPTPPVPPNPTPTPPGPTPTPVDIGDVSTEVNRPTNRQVILPPKSSGNPEAMKKAYNELYKLTQSKINPQSKEKTGEYNEQTGFCARYTYSLALKYIQALKNQPLTDGYTFKPSGNARTAGFGNALLSLGYKGERIGTNVDKATLKSIIDSYSSKYAYGDVFVYFANDISNDSDQSAYHYGHAQIWTGVTNLSAPPGSQKSRSVWDGGKNSHINKIFYAFSNWSSSVKDNYGANFVYNNRNNNKWTIWLYRAPN